TQKLELSLGAGEQKSDVRVELAAKVSVRGTVVDLDGAPVAGLEVKISASKSFRFSLDEADRRHVSDEAGRFEVAQAPTGPVSVLVGRPDHSSAPTVMELQIASGSSVVELPPLRVSRPRKQPGEAAGGLGYVLQQSTPGTLMDEVRHVVARVDGAGPAAAAGLMVG